MSDTASIHLVDDEPALLKALSRLLRSEGFEVRTYVSAEDFLENGATHRPGCLVLDESS